MLFIHIKNIFYCLSSQWMGIKLILSVILKNTCKNYNFFKSFIHLLMVKVMNATAGKLLQKQTAFWKLKQRFKKKHE